MLEYYYYHDQRNETQLILSDSRSPSHLTSRLMNSSTKQRPPGAQRRNCLLAVCSNEEISHLQFHCRNLSTTAWIIYPEKVHKWIRVLVNYTYETLKVVRKAKGDDWIRRSCGNTDFFYFILFYFGGSLCHLVTRGLKCSRAATSSRGKAWIKRPSSGFKKKRKKKAHVEDRAATLRGSLLAWERPRIHAANWRPFNWILECPQIREKRAHTQ